MFEVFSRPVLSDVLPVLFDDASFPVRLKCPFHNSQVSLSLKYCDLLLPLILIFLYFFFAWKIDA